MSGQRFTKTSSGLPGQRRTSLSSCIHRSSSPSYHDSDSPQPSTRSPSRARSPSLDLDDTAAPQMQRNADIKVIKAIISKRLDGPGSESANSAERPSKRGKSSPTQPGRGIRKIIDLYHDLDDLVHKARKHASTITLDDEKRHKADRVEFVGMTKEEIEEELKDRERCHKALQLLNILIPGFEDKAIASGNTTNFCAPLQSGANDARSDDTSRLKMAVADWLNSRMSSGTRLSARAKEERGINNDVTGRLLCPIDFDWDDPIVREKLRNTAPEYDFNSNFFLRCLYEGEEGDPDAPEEGFLKGPLLLRAYRHIFTSPSSADDENISTEITSRRRDVATTLRLNGHVTARSIAYTATQLIFALNSSRDWRQEHAGFHYPSFYNFVVDLLEDENTPLPNVPKFFQWWDSKVFPTMANKGSGSSRLAMKTSQQRLKEARARMKRRAPS